MEALLDRLQLLLITAWKLLDLIIELVRLEAVGGPLPPRGRRITDKIAWTKNRATTPPAFALRRSCRHANSCALPLWTNRDARASATAPALGGVSLCTRSGICASITVITASPMSANVDDINVFLQARLREERQQEVPAVAAARWLDGAGILADSDARPGLPLRNLLRSGQIRGAIQRPPNKNGRWFIARTDQDGAELSDAKPVAAYRSRVRTTPRRATSADDERAARRRRQRAARKYRPDDIELLLVAEAPPTALERYFYFEDVATEDSLFRYVARLILKTEPTRSNKPELLGRLRDRGVFLVDLKQDPLDGAPLSKEVPALVRRVRKLEPRRIIVIKASVYDVVARPLREAGLPLIDVRVPFPGSGQQRRFELEFGRALRRRRSVRR